MELGGKLPPGFVEYQIGTEGEADGKAGEGLKTKILRAAPGPFETHTVGFSG